MEKLLYIDPHRVQDFHPPVLSSTAPNSWNQERAQPSAGAWGWDRGQWRGSPCSALPLLVRLGPRSPLIPLLHSSVAG